MRAWEEAGETSGPADPCWGVLGDKTCVCTPAVTAPEIRPLSKKLEWLIMTFKPVRETEEIPINSEERERGKVPRKGRGCSRWPLGGWRSPRRGPSDDHHGPRGQDSAGANCETLYIWACHHRLPDLGLL